MKIQLAQQLAKCKVCRKESRLTSAFLGVCRDCIIDKYEEAEPHILRAQRKSREEFGLPPTPPTAKNGIKCTLCGNECRIAPNKLGFCATKKNEAGKLKQLAGSPEVGFVDYYYDPLPTNCVASWVCPEGEGRPQSRLFSFHRPKNLAVFYQSCTFNCLFCQNWHFRDSLNHPTLLSAEQLAAATTSDTRCICYFGGDPSSQMVHSIAASRMALKKAEGRTLRICWETNGSLNRSLLRRAAEISLKSGGCIKFDLKTWNEKLNLALTGVSNKTTLENFQWLAEFARQRKDPPLIVASTLLVPGYVNEDEVGDIARFIASCDPGIPYSLLAFHPQFFFADLPITCRAHAIGAKKRAQKAGLKNVHIGNLHLLITQEY